MNNIDRLQTKIDALKAVQATFLSEIINETETLRAISIKYKAQAETADKSTKSTLTALTKKLDKAIIALEKVGD